MIEFGEGGRAEQQIMFPLSVFSLFFVKLCDDVSTWHPWGVVAISQGDAATMRESKPRDGPELKLHIVWTNSCDKMKSMELEWLNALFILILLVLSVERRAT